MIEIQSKDGKHNFTVTGVIDESLGKSHIRGNLFMTMNSGGIGDCLLHEVAQEWAGGIVKNSYIKLCLHTNVVIFKKNCQNF